MDDVRLEVTTNAYLVNKNIRNAYLLQTSQSNTVGVDINKDIQNLLKLYPTLKISTNYTEYQGSIISKHNFNNQVISDEKMGKILEYPCSKDWSKIRGDTNHIIYRLYAIINNNYEILLIINKCLNDHKDKFRKLQTIYKQSLKRKEYSDLIYNTCNIKIKTINVKLKIEKISSIYDIIYKSVCNIRLNKADKNYLRKWSKHGIYEPDVIQLINTNELFIRNTIKKRAIAIIPTLNKNSAPNIFRNKKQKMRLVRGIGLNIIVSRIFI